MGDFVAFETAENLFRGTAASVGLGVISARRSWHPFKMPNQGRDLGKLALRSALGMKLLSFSFSVRVALAGASHGCRLINFEDT